MTARLATHPDVASRATDVVERLVAAGVDVDFSHHDSEATDPLLGVREATVDLALVGISALRDSKADDLTTVAVLPREEVREVLVCLRGDRTPLTSLRRGARIGVAGARQTAFLLAHRPDLEPVDLAGASATELREREHDLDAVVLGAVEARAAGLLDATAEALDPKSWLPAPGKGALALIARHPIAEATALDHLPTRTALRAELALLDALDTEANAPLGSLAQPSGKWIRLWAAAAATDGTRLVRSDMTGPLDEPEAIGAAVAKQLTERGIDLVLAPPLAQA